MGYSLQKLLFVCFSLVTHSLQWNAMTCKKNRLHLLTGHRNIVSCSLSLFCCRLFSNKNIGRLLCVRNWDFDSNSCTLHICLCDVFVRAFPLKFVSKPKMRCTVMFEIYVFRLWCHRTNASTTVYKLVAWSDKCNWYFVYILQHGFIEVKINILGWVNENPEKIFSVAIAFNMEC